MLSVWTECFSHSEELSLHCNFDVQSLRWLGVECGYGRELVFTVVSCVQVEDRYVEAEKLLLSKHINFRKAKGED